MMLKSLSIDLDPKDDMVVFAENCSSLQRGMFHGRDLPQAINQVNAHLSLNNCIPILRTDYHTWNAQTTIDMLTLVATQFVWNYENGIDHAVWGKNHSAWELTVSQQPHLFDLLRIQVHAGINLVPKGATLVLTGDHLKMVTTANSKVEPPSIVLTPGAKQVIQETGYSGPWVLYRKEPVPNIITITPTR